jgi:hypothetical protein
LIAITTRRSCITCSPIQGASDNVIWAPWPSRGYCAQQQKSANHGQKDETHVEDGMVIFR